MIHEDANADTESRTGWLVGLIATVRRSVMLLLVALGVVLVVFAAVVLPAVGLDTSAGLLAVSGFNVAVIGLVGHVVYKLLERRF